MTQPDYALRDSVTRGEFRQFERRMDERFDGLGHKVDALHKTVTDVITEDEQGEWLGPRAWLILELVTPATVGALVAWALATHFFRLS